MEGINAKLHAVRLQWGLTLREVEERSARLAAEWGDPSYQISASWLARVERGKHELTIPKLIALASTYNLAPEDLLRQCRPGAGGNMPSSATSGPNSTLLLTTGSLAGHARQLLPDSLTADSAPDETGLLPLDDGLFSSPFRYAIIGRCDRTLEPMIRTGSTLKIDTQKRAIAPRREWSNEFDRPIYFLLTRTGYVCGWCELDKDATWLTVVSHHLSHAPSRRWRYRKEIEVIGRVVGVAMRLVD